MLLPLITVALFFPLVRAMDTNVVSKVTETCQPSQSVCEFQWTIENRQTMVWYDGVLAHPVVWRNGSFWARYSCKDTNSDIKLTEAQLKTVIMADGEYKFIETINQQLPGPSVVAYEGQEIVIKITNKLWQEGISIHWHGILQQNTNWMDGVPAVTQCAINPMETFTYRFIAEPVGTHWWHSHVGLQRGDGVFGALIILPHPNKTPKVQSTVTDPDFDKEFIMIVNDWIPVQENNAVTSFMNDLKPYMYDNWNNSGQCFTGSAKAPNGVSAATFEFNAALINGKGYKFDSNMQPLVDVPLETYTVEAMKYYRFRVINAASAYAFKISVDNHNLTVIASDGKLINPVEADSFIVNTGERFDFYIYTDQSVDNYWIRAETIEIVTHYTLAILKYNGAGMTNPTSQATCMGASCIVVNCPFQSFIRGPFVTSTCYNFEKITSRTNYERDTSGNFREIFVPFEKTDSIYNRRYDTSQGIQFEFPSTPPAAVHDVRYNNPCDPEICANQPCQCTNQINLKLGYTVQIVLVSNTTHPIHFHGHYFEVIKIGYPPAGHDTTTFKSLRSSPDYMCNNDFCNNAVWTNSSWNNDNVPDTNLVNPPLKDTIAIPAYGYVVLRFKTNNPGWWIMHCHIETHIVQGMAVLFQSGSLDQINPPPVGFPRCGSFPLSQQDFLAAKDYQMTTTTTESSDSDDDDNGWTDREKILVYGYIGVALAGIIVGIIVHVIYVSCRSKPSTDYKM